MSATQAPVQPAGPAAPARRGNPFGITAMVLGIIAVVFSFIPVVGFISFILGPLAVIFGVVGLLRKQAGKGTSIAGLVLGVAAIVIAAMVTAMVSAGLNAAADSLDESINAEHSVEYVVTTNGEANVTYFSGSGSSSEDIKGDWSETITATGFELVSLSVMGDFMNDDAEVSCEIIIDGQSVAQNAGSGSGAMASCSASTTGNE